MSEELNAHIACTRCDHEIEAHKIVRSGVQSVRRGPCSFKTYASESTATVEDWHCTCYSFTRQMGIRRALSADQDKS